MKYLEKLARIFQDNKSRLYVVGSFVRKIVCGDESLDVDLCSNLSPKQIEKIIDGTDFELANVNEGYLRATIKVKGRSDVWFDYTAFRKDVYAKNGWHHPVEVKQVKTIREDYVRRDFTINAIYFDPLINEYYDYCGGLIDLQHRLLKTIKNPDDCFASDALRIVRMVRFAVDGPYNIEYETFQAAKRQAEKISAIKQSKIDEELSKLKNTELGFKLLREIFPWKKF